MDEKSLASYLGAIKTLQEKQLPASTVNIADMLSVKPSSVTEMLQKLAKDNYLVYKPYRDVKLTEKGRRFASRLVRKQRLLETFLKNTLKLNDSEVSRQARGLVHSLSDHADQQLCIFLSRPKEDPIEHLEIPHCSKKISCEKCLKGKVDDSEPGHQSIR